MPDSPFQIGLTLQRLVHSAGSSDELYRAVRVAHPDAKKKDIILGALGVMIDQCEAHGLAAKNGTPWRWTAVVAKGLAALSYSVPGRMLNVCKVVRANSVGCSRA